MDNKMSFDFLENRYFSYDKKVLYDCIEDRGSKFTPVGGIIKTKEDIKKFLVELVKEKQFKKASHNSFAYRIKLDNGSILEGRNDDGEAGAGNCILRELQRENFVNTIVIVSRHFGGIHLHADRFKHIINATKEILKISK